MRWSHSLYSVALGGFLFGIWLFGVLCTFSTAKGHLGWDWIYTHRRKRSFASTYCFVMYSTGSQGFLDHGSTQNVYQLSYRHIGFQTVEVNNLWHLGGYERVEDFRLYRKIIRVSRLSPAYAKDLPYRHLNSFSFVRHVTMMSHPPGRFLIVFLYVRKTLTYPCHSPLSDLQFLVNPNRE